MHRTAIVAVLVLGAHLASLANDSDQKIDRHPLEIGTSVDFGQIVKGEKNDVNNEATDGQMIQRTGVYFNQITTVNNRLDIKVGVGGLFFFSYPEAQRAVSRSVKFGPGVGQAQGVYTFGDIEDSFLTAQFGFFPYKYNPDAKNLGEYLLRSGTYPGYQVTGGWSLINSAAYMASGFSLHSSFLDGKLKADLNVFLERDLDPIYDLSPSIVMSYKPASIFEIGAGVQFSHLIPVAPRKLKSRSIVYDYTLQDTVVKTKPTVDGLSTYEDTTIVSGPVVVSQFKASAASQKYTFKGTKLMGRVSLNFGALLENEFIGPEGLKFYSEVALLGVKDYPYYYADKLQRMPILVGMNMPNFGFFDILAVEVEYRKWGFPNSTKGIQDGFEPLYTLPDVLDSTWNEFDKKWDLATQQSWTAYDPKHPVYWEENSDGTFKKVDVSEGNLKWTVYAKKQFMPGFGVYVQMASDHLRMIREDFTFSREVTTRIPSQWYYLVRLDFGI